MFKALISFTLMTLVTTLAVAAPQVDATAEQGAKGDEGKPVLIAQKRGGGKAKGKNGGRERILSGEARGTFKKGSDKRNIDFDAADIGGVRKTPMGSLVSQSKADKNYDFVKIRLRWHAEMFQSASSLEAGNN